MTATNRTTSRRAPRTAFSRSNQTVRCRVCRTLTHTDVDGCIGLDLCRVCRLEAEMENAHNDGHHEGAPEFGCPDCEVPARLDADGTARPLTRLVAHVPAGACIGGSVQPEALETVATGERMALAPEESAFAAIVAAGERRTVALARLDAIRAEQVVAVAEFEAAQAAIAAACAAYPMAVR